MWWFVERLVELEKRARRRMPNKTKGQRLKSEVQPVACTPPTFLPRGLSKVFHSPKQRFREEGCLLLLRSVAKRGQDPH